MRDREPAEAVMRDGVVLRADLYRPSPSSSSLSSSPSGPWPVLLARCPYGRRDPGILDRLRPWAAARRGFLVVVQDVRGRFGSDGDWEPLVHEYDDGYDTVRWAAGLPGCDGRVAMYGPSYLGHAQWAAVAAAPPELVAAIPEFTWADPYDGLVARGGGTELGLLAQWSLGLGDDLLRRRYAAAPERLHRALAELADTTAALHSRVHWELPGHDLPSLRHLALPVPGRPGGPPLRTSLDGSTQPTVPTLTVAGWYDAFLQGSLDNHRRARAAGAPAGLIVGPWTHDNQTRHIGQVDFGVAADAATMDGGASLATRELDWLEARLAARPAGRDPDRAGTGSPDPARSAGAPGPLHAPATTAATSGASASAAAPVLVFVMGINRWRPLDSWPPPAAETPWYLHPEGGLSPLPPSPGHPAARGDIGHQAEDPVPTHGGALLLTADFPAGPHDQRVIEQRADVLVHTSEPLTAPLAVIGRVSAALVVTAAAAGADWVVRLCDVGPDGLSLNLADGILRAGHTDPTPREITVDLWSTAHVFLPGHRLRVQVAAAGFPRWDRNPAAIPGPAIQTVHYGAARPSRLLLPHLAETGGPPAVTWR